VIVKGGGYIVEYCVTSFEVQFKLEPFFSKKNKLELYAFVSTWLIWCMGWVAVDLFEKKNVLGRHRQRC
jgi:hypothetical protein